MGQSDRSRTFAAETALFPRSESKYSEAAPWWRWMIFAGLIWSVTEKRKNSIYVCGKTKVTNRNGVLLPTALHRASRPRLRLRKLWRRHLQLFGSPNHSVQGRSSRFEQSSLLLSQFRSFLRKQIEACSEGNTRFNPLMV